MNHRTQHLALAAFVLSLAGCAGTSVKQVWKSPSYQGGPVHKVAVLAVDERGLVREALENRFVRDLVESGEEALATRELLSLQEIKADKEAAAARLRAAGADTILIVRMVDQATYSRDVAMNPSLYNYGTSAFSGLGWYDFYSLAFLNLGSVPGAMDRKFYLTSTLFELNTGQSVWSALTVSLLKEQTDALVIADGLAAKVVKALRKDGMVR